MLECELVSFFDKKNTATRRGIRKPEFEICILIYGTSLALVGYILNSMPYIYSIL